MQAEGDDRALLQLWRTRPVVYGVGAAWSRPDLVAWIERRLTAPVKPASAPAPNSGAGSKGSGSVLVLPGGLAAAGAGKAEFKNAVQVVVATKRLRWC